MSFSSLGLSSFLVEALSTAKFTKPYPIQEKAIPVILDKKDVLGIAKTGSGKTASYVLPILNNIQIDKSDKCRHAQILVLVPTRELAMQVESVFKEFAQALPNKLKCMAVYGGVSINPQMKALSHVNVLIATPGRLLELVECNAVKLSEVNTLVLDEADKMLNLGFKEEMDSIFKLLPLKRQNLLFSATLSKHVENINALYLNNPVVIKIEEEADEIQLIDQVAYAVEESKKGPLLRYLIKENNIDQVLVFTSSTFKADSVTKKLRQNNISAVAVHGKKSQGSRNESLRRFKKGEIQVLVTTDLLSRGIDIESLPYVINYELPRSPKDYIHRIGRTGRAESTGKAISLVSPEEKHHFKVIQKKMKRWVEYIDAAEINLKGY